MKQKPLRVFNTGGRQIDMPVTNSNILFPVSRQSAASRLQYGARMLSSQLLTAQENERKRVSREIHDGLGQMLSAIKFTLENNFSRNEGDTIERKEQLQPLLLMVQECIEETRRVQMDLRPPMLDDLGILATISWFTRKFASTYSTIRINKRIEIEENEVPDSIKTVIFRVMQEAFNNISKHSQASLVSLSLRRRGNRIELLVSDNGMGLDLEKASLADGIRRGYGLSSMRERAELSGGSFSIESLRGKGTTIRIEWLLREES
jgi:signal transduction histidine kinase